MLNKENKSRKEDVWQYQEAKAKLSQVMDLVQEKGMQVIIRNRDEVYIVLSKEKYDEYTRPNNSLVDFFLSAPCSEIDIDIKRSKEGPREVEL